jgi:hypothetical protein
VGLDRLPVNDGRGGSDKDMCSELTAVIHAALEDHCQVYVHCDNITGNYRSATVVVAYMIKYDMLLDGRSTMYRPVDARLSFSENIFMNALIEYSISLPLYNHGYRENREFMSQDSERD